MMNDKLTNHLRNLYDLQSVSRYECARDELLIKKYYRVINLVDLFNEEKYNEVV